MRNQRRNRLELEPKVETNKNWTWNGSQMRQPGTEQTNEESNEEWTGTEKTQSKWNKLELETKVETKGDMTRNWGNEQPGPGTHSRIDLDPGIGPGTDHRWDNLERTKRIRNQIINKRRNEKRTGAEAWNEKRGMRRTGDTRNVPCMSIPEQKRLRLRRPDWHSLGPVPVPGPGQQQQQQQQQQPALHCPAHALAQARISTLYVSTCIPHHHPHTHCKKNTTTLGVEWSRSHSDSTPTLLQLWLRNGPESELESFFELA
jgi:hypothetical protein